VRGEIEARLRELRPLVDEHEELLSAIGALEVQSDAPAPVRAAKPAKPARRSAARTRAKKSVQGVEKPARPAPTPERAPRGAAAEAIVAALEHGSHTVSELTIVTAMSAQNIRNNLRRLLQAQAVTQTKREGKTAYALSSARSTK
jgi:hypothetical protein